MDKATFLQILGKRIVELRKQKNWTQAELANACEKDRQSIDRLEHGKVNPSIYYLKEVAEALEMPVSRLLE